MSLVPAVLLGPKW